MQDQIIKATPSNERGTCKNSFEVYRGLTKAHLDSVFPADSKVKVSLDELEIERGCIGGVTTTTTNASSSYSNEQLLEFWTQSQADMLFFIDEAAEKTHERFRCVIRRDCLDDVAAKLETMGFNNIVWTSEEETSPYIEGMFRRHLV